MLRRLPRLFRLGLGLVALGSAGDLADHALLAPLTASAAPLSGPAGPFVHLFTLAGMVTVLVSVLQRGLRRDRAAGTPPADAD